jgi:Domain of unknown function (DUF4349)
MNRFRRIGVILAAFFLAAWAVGCASSSSPKLSASSNSVPRGASGATGQNAAGQLASAGSIGSKGTGFEVDASLPQLGPKIVKVADVDLALKSGGFQTGLQQAVQIAGRYEGFVVSTTVARSTGSVVIRVPAARFEAALADLKGLGKVTRQNVSGHDVSQEFVDLQARLRNASAQEAVLLRLMDQARTVSATIRVERELQSVQLEIERLKGQLRYLDSQTAMSTITLGLSQVGVVAHTQGTIQKAWHQAGEALVSMVASVIVGAAYLLPLALIALLVLGAFRRLRPRFSS